MSFGSRVPVEALGVVPVNQRHALTIAVSSTASHAEAHSAAAASAAGSRSRRAQASASWTRACSSGSSSSGGAFARSSASIRSSRASSACASSMSGDSHGFDANGRFVSARAQLCDARGFRADAEQRVVELAQELAAIAVQEHGDEHPADEVERRLAEALDEIGALLRRLAEQCGGAHARGPGAVAVAERGAQGLPQLLGPKRIVLEERELPAVERVAEPGVVVGEPTRLDPFRASVAVQLRPK